VPLLHDTAVRTQIRARVEGLRPEARRRWGRMTADQMLWHVNSSLEVALGRKTAAAMWMPLPHAVLRLVALYLPWPKGAPTMPEIVASGRRDFETERSRCLALIDEFVRRDIGARWPVHPILGPIPGRAHSRLQAKHVDHHLRQFGA
jgi:hypothetical protein